MLAFLEASHTNAQKASSDDTYNLIVSDQPLGTVLDQLARTAGVTFSYNPDQIGINRKVSLRISGKTLREIMRELFDEDTFDFRQRGNQVVIFRKGDTDSESKSTINSTHSKELQEIKPDTVYLVKERVVTDTITLIETQIKTDTVFVAEKQPENKIGSKDIFRNNPPMYARLKPEFSVDVGLKVSPLFSYRSYTADEDYGELLKAYRKADSGYAFSGAAGIVIGVNYERLCFISGVEMVQLAHRFNYNFITTTGGYYLKDTLDAYYTVSNNDTAWFYLVDSSYLSEDIKQFRYNTLVRYLYLDFPLMIQYNLPVARNLIHFNAGIIAGVSVGKSGYYLSSDNQTVADTKTLNNRPLLFSAKVGAGVSLPISSKLVLNAGIHYRHALQSVYKDFTIKIYPAALGADFSLIMRL